MWCTSTMPGNGPSPFGLATYAWISSPRPPGTLVISAVTLTCPSVSNEFHTVPLTSRRSRWWPEVISRRACAPLGILRFVSDLREKLPGGAHVDVVRHYRPARRIWPPTPGRLSDFPGNALSFDRQAVHGL